jgi:glycosyltransferase involved in cell wall biosynthesis
VSERISVVLPAHDAATVIGDQLAALTRQVGVDPLQIVVVLDGCSDDTRGVVERNRPPFGERLVVVELPMSRGAAAARNAGVMAAAGDLLLFCDADDVVDPSWAAAMVTALADADVVGGRLDVRRDGAPTWAIEALYERTAGGASHTLDGRYGYAPSSCLGCRRTAFEAVGGFDERFTGAGGEDADFGFRVQASGHTFGRAPDAVVSYTPRTRFADIARQRVRYARGTARFHAHHGLHPAGGIGETVRSLGRRVLDPRVLTVGLFTTVAYRRERRRLERARRVNGTIDG